MKLTLALALSLAVFGCKKKDDAGAPAADKSADKSIEKSGDKMADKAADKAADKPAANLKSCADMGGTTEAGKPTDCYFKNKPSPFDAVFTGKFDEAPMRPGKPGAVFKVTSHFDRPAKIRSAQLYAYNKAGAQIDIVAGTSKVPYAQDSMSGLIEIAPGETKEFIHSVGKEMVPDMDTVQLEFMAWTSADGKEEWSRNVDDLDKRPKDGWKK